MNFLLLPCANKYMMMMMMMMMMIVTNNAWNYLSSLLSADSVNCFKNRQDIIYDYQADIHGTGNRSEVVF